MITRRSFLLTLLGLVAGVVGIRAFRNTPEVVSTVYWREFSLLSPKERKSLLTHVNKEFEKRSLLVSRTDALKQMVQSDFREGKVYLHNGWVVSETEVFLDLVNGA